MKLKWLSKSKILEHLRNAGFKKKFGFTCSYLFQVVFILVFHHKNGFNCFRAINSEAFPGEDTIYRFLNHYGYARRRFLSFLSSSVVTKVHNLASKDVCLVVDDSMFVNPSNCWPVALIILKIATVKDFAC